MLINKKEAELSREEFPEALTTEDIPNGNIKVLYSLKNVLIKSRKKRINS